MSQEIVCSFCTLLWQIHWACIKHGLSTEFKQFELTGHQGAIQKHMELAHGMKFPKAEITK